MKKVVFFILLFSNFSCFAQNNQGWFLGDYHYCMENVNNPNIQVLPSRRASIDATFRVIGNGGACTGTLVNRNVSDAQIGYYFITANHCFGNLEAIGGDNPNGIFQFAFNYQSPDGDTWNTHLSNRNTITSYPMQSLSIADNKVNYYHYSKVRRVDNHTT
jgi:hypothetical protein